MFSIMFRSMVIYIFYSNIMYDGSDRKSIYIKIYFLMVARQLTIKKLIKNGFFKSF